MGSYKIKGKATSQKLSAGKNPRVETPRPRCDLITAVRRECSNKTMEVVWREGRRPGIPRLPKIEARMLKRPTYISGL
jgi:hypothetical protein